MYSIIAPNLQKWSSYSSWKLVLKFQFFCFFLTLTQTLAPISKQQFIRQSCHYARRNKVVSYDQHFHWVSLLKNKNSFILYQNGLIYFDFNNEKKRKKRFKCFETERFFFQQSGIHKIGKIRLRSNSSW